MFSLLYHCQYLLNLTVSMSNTVGVL